MTEQESSSTTSTRRYTGDLMALRHGLEATVGQAQFNPEGTLRVMRGEAPPAPLPAEAEPIAVATATAAVEPRALASAAQTLENIIARIATGKPDACMPMAERVALAVRLCQVVASTHAGGVALNDIKPSLVTVGAFGEIGLSERGAATPFGAIAKVGTPAYMSPEQARGEPASLGSDIYAIGVVCHRLFTMRFPLWDTNPERFWERKRRGEYDEVPDGAPAVPAALLAICRRALAPRPEERYPHAAALAADLQAYLTGGRVQAVPEGVGRWILRGCRRWRWPLALTACILVAIALGVHLSESHEARYVRLFAQMEASESAYADRLAQATARGEALNRRLMESESRIGWKSVAILDFSQPIDPRFEMVQVNERLRLETAATQLQRQVNGKLEVLPAPFRTFLRWREGISEDARVDVEVEREASSGWNLDLAVAGDSLTGYRLRLDGADYLALETVERGWADQLAVVRDASLGRRQHLSISLRHVAGHVVVLLDGQEVIRYLDPRPISGPEHRAVSIGRFFDKGVLRIRRMTIWTRAPGEYVGVLDPGIAWLRAGKPAEARAWFDQIATDPPTPQIGAEALFRAALALPVTADRMTALNHLARQPGYALAGHACLAAIDDTVGEGRWDDLLMLIGQLRGLGQADLMRRAELLLIGRLQASQTLPSDRLPLLRAIATTGTAEFHVPKAGLSDIASIHGAAFADVWISDNVISDLVPIVNPALRRLKADGNAILQLPSFGEARLETVDLSRNPLMDLQPFADQPQLRSLAIAGTQVSDLAPLTGSHVLERLDASRTGVADLTALAGKPLRMLSLVDAPVQDLRPLERCGTLEDLLLPGTRVKELAPLAGCTALQFLSLARTPVEDLRPIASLQRMASLDLADTPVFDLAPIARLPLKRVDLSGTKITDIRPLAGMPLQRLSLARTAVVDLLPLVGMPLSRLDLSGWQRQDLSPLLQLKLESLTLPPGPYTEAQERVLYRLSIAEVHLDPADSWQWKVVGQMRGLRRINGMPVEAALAAQAECLELMSGGRPRFTSLSHRVSGSRMVLLPILVTAAEANEVAARVRARLPVLADHAILTAVMRMMYDNLPRSGAAIHIGLAATASGLCWVDGTMAQERLLAPTDIFLLQRGGAAVYDVGAVTVVRPADSRAYLALEFPD